jgi:hypothetical protein
MYSLIVSWIRQRLGWKYILFPDYQADIVSVTFVSSLGPNTADYMRHRWIFTAAGLHAIVSFEYASLDCQCLTSNTPQRKITSYLHGVLQAGARSFTVHCKHPPVHMLQRLLACAATRCV